MILKTHNEFVVFDVGEKYIKALLVRTNWNGNVELVYGTQIASKGLVFNSIENLRSLSDAFFQLIYRLEVDVGTSIKSVIIIFSCCTVSIQKFHTSINVGGLVKEGHLQNLDYRLNLNLDKAILGFLYKNYKLDNLEKIHDPIHMCGGSLFLNASFLTIDHSFIRNLVTSFNRNDIDVGYAGLANLVSSSLVMEENFLMVDVGFSSTRIFIKTSEENSLDIAVIPRGFKLLIDALQKIGHTAQSFKESSINISFENPQDQELTNLCRKFFKELFALVMDKIKTYAFLSKLNVNIYLINGITLVPLIDMFLMQTFDRNFVVFDIKNKFSCIFNRNIFTNCVAAALYITSKKENVDFFMKIE